MIDSADISAIITMALLILLFATTSAKYVIIWPILVLELILGKQLETTLIAIVVITAVNLIQIVTLLKLLMKYMDENR